MNENDRPKSSNKIMPLDHSKNTAVELKEFQVYDSTLTSNTNGSVVYSIEESKLSQRKGHEENKKMTSSDAYSDESEDEDDDDGLGQKADGFIGKFILSIKNKTSEAWNNPLTSKVIALVLFIGYLVYFGFAMGISKPFNFPSNVNSSTILDSYVFAYNPGLALFVLTIINFLLLSWDNIFIVYFSHKISKKFKDSGFQKSKVHAILQKFGSWILVGLILLGIIIYLSVAINSTKNLISLSGLFAFIFVAVILSNHPSKINWHILISGLEIQFILGVLLMRTEFGYKLFKFISSQVTTFLNYTNQGSKLVFGDAYTDHPFAFQSIPIIIFFSAIINLLYYLGFVQYLILKLSWVVNGLMKTSPTESMNATANIFLGQTEAPLLIKPFLPTMTKSEIFSVMTGGFATVAGSVLGAYINFKIPANHLIIASIMAAPGALLVSKTIFPETKKTKANWEAIKNLPPNEAKNIFEALSTGASSVVGPIGGIISCLIAFTAFFAFINSIFIWVFGMVGVENFGLTSLMQYIFFPFSYLMGVEYEDCKVVSKLIGIKVFVNEFVAYAEMGDIIKFRNNLTAFGELENFKYGNSTFEAPPGLDMIWNDRSILIATYALCGFANFASVGITIGGLSALAPTRMKVFTKYAVKAMIAGNITNFITACIAGLLYDKL